MARKPLDLEYFKKLVEQGLNCKQIAAKMGYHTHTFGLKIKNNTVSPAASATGPNIR